MRLTENQVQYNQIADIKNSGLPVIIFGVGIVGEALFHACSRAGITVAGFCDNNINKTRSTLCGRKIVYTPHLKASYDRALFIISAADIKDVVEQLQEMGYPDWCPAGLFLKDIDLALLQLSTPTEFAEFAVNACLLCHDSYVNPDKLFLRSVDIIITERCSLKCRNCSNLMQYYRKPRDCGLAEIMQSIDAFCSFVDEVHEFRVIGGEPFMNKDMHLVVKRLINEPKVKKIVIYTNGTIAPRENQMRQLRSDKVLFFISDYGTLSKKINDLTRILREQNIAYHTRKAGGWTDCSTIGKHGRTPEQQKELFKKCCAKNLVTISAGRIYRCPFSANAARLSAVPDYPNDSIDILHGLPETIDEMKNKIRRFLMEIKFLESCDYCGGRPLDAPEIAPAIQTAEPLTYDRLSS